MGAGTAPSAVGAGRSGRESRPGRGLRRLAAQAHEQLRELGSSGRHLYPWFERHRDVLARGLAAEVALDAAQSAVYHALGAPAIASLTAACLTPDRAIDLGQLERLVKRNEDAQQRLLFEVAAELYGHEQGVSLSELFAELDGEDLDRVLEAIAVGKRRRSTIQGRRTISGYAPPSQASRNMTAEVDRPAMRCHRVLLARHWSGCVAPGQAGRRRRT